MAHEDTIVRGTVQVALHFGVSRRTVQRWCKAPTFPKLSGRRFDLLQIRAWLDAKDGREPAAPAGRDPRQPELPVSRGKDFQEERLKRAQADLKEMEVRQRRGELVELRVVEQLFVDRIMTVRQGLASLSRSLPPLLATCGNEREMEVVIADRVWKLQEEFARPLPENVGGGGASAGLEMAQVAEFAFIDDLKEKPECQE
jgi:phage terminase Nu1 subunit (DNA packaging protein)